MSFRAMSPHISTSTQRKTLMRSARSQIARGGEFSLLTAARAFSRPVKRFAPTKLFFVVIERRTFVRIALIIEFLSLGDRQFDLFQHGKNAEPFRRSNWVKHSVNSRVRYRPCVKIAHGNQSIIF